jgi:hypothetical protein
MSPQDESDGISAVKANAEDKNGALYVQMERGGLNYIKNKRNYLILSGIVPFLSLFVQIVNLYLTLDRLFFFWRYRDPSKPFHVFENPFLLIDFITPLIPFLLFSLLALVHFIYLFRWKKKVNRYEEHQKKAIATQEEISDIHVTLTQLFYDIIDNMETIKKIFIALNVVVLLNLQWFFRFFLKELLAIISPRWYIKLLRGITPWMNLLLYALLLFYFIMNWRHFKRWNKKLNKLKKFEKQVYSELDMEDKLLVISGNDEDLSKIENILIQQKRNLSLKYVSISDKEEFDKRFDKALTEKKEF